MGWGHCTAMGITTQKAFLDSKLESMPRILAMNTLAPNTIAQGVARDMVARGSGGSNVNVSSIAAQIGFAKHMA